MILALQLSAMKQQASGVLVRYKPTGNALRGREGGERGTGRERERGREGERGREREGERESGGERERERKREGKREREKTRLNITKHSFTV